MMQNVLVLVLMAYLAAAKVMDRMPDGSVADGGSCGGPQGSALCASGVCCQGLTADVHAGGALCYQDVIGYCAFRPIADGQACGFNDECKSKHCCGQQAEKLENGKICPGGPSVCATEAYSDGANCFLDLECKSGKCDKTCLAKPADSSQCPEGWIGLDNTCGSAEQPLCATIGAPLKFVSWLHLQYQCDLIGGYLPEPTADNLVNLELILSSLHSLYAKDTPILMYLGATDVTRKNDWRWLKSASPLSEASEGSKWSNGVPNTADNKDCLALQSSDKLWRNVNCEDDSLTNQIANICFGSPATAKALPAN